MAHALIDHPAPLPRTRDRWEAYWPGPAPWAGSAAALGGWYRAVDEAHAAHMAEEWGSGLYRKVTTVEVVEEFQL